MRNFYCVFFSFLLLIAGRSNAQTTTPIGTGTVGNTGTTYPAALQDYYEGARGQFLYLASELSTAGMIAGPISSISFNVTNLNTYSGTIQEFTIKIGGTAVTTLGTTTTSWETVSNTVYGPVDYTVTAGVNTFVFSTPFVWNGTDNIVIEICNGLPANTSDGLIHYTQNPTIPWTTGLSFNGSHMTVIDNAGNLCNSTAASSLTVTQTTRPNISFTWVPATACTGSPEAGSVVAPSTACANTNLSLSLSGNTQASGLNYQWQYSTDNSNWTNLTGATTPTVMITHPSTRYYRAYVVCTSSTLSDTTASTLVSSPALVQGTFTVNSTVATGGSNFQSFADAINYIKCGINGPVVFNVAPGTAYDEKIVIPNIGGASLTNSITINGNGAIITLNSTTLATAITLDGSKFVTIDSLTIDAATSTNAWGILLTNQADSNVIKSCTINLNTTLTTTAAMGIISSGSAASATTQGNNANGNLIENNVINGGYYGISMYGSTTTYNKNNVVRNNTINDFYYYSIYSYGQQDNIISSNEISRTTRTTVSSYNVYLSSNNGGILFEKNKIHNVFGGGTAPTTFYNIYIASASNVANPSRVQNNLVYDISGNGAIYGVYALGYANWNFYHNTIVLDDGSATGGTTYGMYVYGTNVNVKNNIVYITRGGSGTKYCLYYATTGVTASNRNVLYMGSTSGTNGIGYLGSGKTTLSDWKTTNNDLNSVDVDPLFAGGGDYTPSEVAINNLGESGLGVTEDINGVTRASSPDPGAYEFAPAGTDASLTWVSPVTPTSKGLKTITVALNNNSASGNLTSANLSYTDGSTVITQNFTGLSIAPGASQNLSFTTQYDAQSYIKLTAYINLVNGSLDLTQLNDTTTQTLCFALKGNYTINQTAPASATNFTGFSTVIQALNCAGIDSSVVFTVAPGSGPYYGPIVLDSIKGATKDRKVTFYGSGEKIEYNTSNSTARTGLILNGADHVIIDSFLIDVSAGTYGWGIVLLNRADSNIIRNCTITTNATSTSTNYAGIVLNGSASSTGTSGNNANGNVIEMNTITGGYYGVYLYGSTTPYNLNNIVRNNIINDVYYYSVYTYGQQDNLISGNDISRPTRTAVSSYNLYVSTNNGGIVMEKNKVHDMFPMVTAATVLYNIYIGASGVAANPNRVENNLMYNISGNGTIYGIYMASYNYTNIYHNTLVMDDQSATGGTTYGIYAYGATAVNVKNNIVYITRGGTGTKYCLYYSSTGVTSSNNNVLYMNAPAGTNHIGYLSSARTTLADWQVTGHDANSKSIDPVFVGSGDYTPTEVNINNMGASGLGVTTDITGAVRGASPDPGAYEFTVVGTDGSLSWVAPGMPAVQGLQTVTVKITNNSASGNITSANITYTDGTIVQTQNFTGLNIAPGANQDVSFTTQYNVAYNVRLTAFLNTVNGSPDLSQLNDTTSQYLCFSLKGVYTINQGAAASATNFASFGDAFAALTCGGVDSAVVLNVVPGSGPYYESATLGQIANTSASYTVTINGNGETVAHSTSDGAARTAIVLNGADFVIIDSLNIDLSTGTYGWGIVLMNGANDNIIRNCTILNNTSESTTNFSGIVINGSASGTAVSGNNGNRNLIHNNTITGGYYGIYLYGASATPNKQNIVRDNTITDFYAYGIYTLYQDSSTYSKNDMARPTRTASGTVYGIYGSSCTNLLVEKNKVHNLYDAHPTSTSATYPIYLPSTGISAAQPNRVENNLIYEVNGGSGTIYGIYIAGYNNWSIYHNTVVLDYAAATAGTTYGLYTYGTAMNIKNNIVYVTRGGTGTKYCLYYSTTGVASSNRNVLYMGSTSGTNGIGYYSSGKTTLTDWKTTNYDLNSSDADPSFPGAGDYKPTEQLINNMAEAGLVLTDIADVVRSTSPDPGAYEFSVLTPGLNMSADGLVAPAASGNNCYAATEAVTIKIVNLSESTIDFAVNPVTVTVNVTGAVTQTLTKVLISGTLASDSSMNVTMDVPLNMLTAGTYTFDASTSVTGDANPSNDAMPTVTRTKTALAAGTVAATPGELCAYSPLVPTLSSTGTTGYSDLQWQQSANTTSGFTNISGATTNPFVLGSAPTQAMYYRLVASCSGNGDTSSVFALSYNNPMVTSTTPDTTCGTGSVTLQATANAGATLNWYETATGGTAIATGNSFTTPSITTTTKYYVSASLGGGTGSAGLQNAISTTGYTQEAGLIFDALSTFTLMGVNVYPMGSGSGTVTINVENTSNVVIHTTTVTLTGTGAPYVKTYVPLNWVIPAGTNYKINMLTPTGSVTGLVRESGASWGSYPLTTAGVISITNGKCCPDAASASYYYFYDWLVSTACESGRDTVEAFVDYTPGCSTVPVTMLSLQGDKQGSVNNLSWSTVSEAHNSGFEIQRSVDGQQFSKLAFVNSKGENGNSSSLLTYSYQDAKPLATTNYYRLKQINKDGSYRFSNVISIKGNDATRIEFTSVYPNPVINSLNVVLTAPSADNVTLVITDIMGKVVLREARTLKAGSNLFNLNVNSLAQGTYIIKAVCSKGCEGTVTKFVK